MLLKLVVRKLDYNIKCFQWFDFKGLGLVRWSAVGVGGGSGGDNGVSKYFFIKYIGAIIVFNARGK